MSALAARKLAPAPARAVTQEQLLRLVKFPAVRRAISGALERAVPERADIPGARGRYIAFRIADPKTFHPALYATIPVGKRGTLLRIGTPKAQIKRPRELSAFLSRMRRTLKTGDRKSLVYQLRSAGIIGGSRAQSVLVPIERVRAVAARFLGRPAALRKVGTNPILATLGISNPKMSFDEWMKAVDEAAMSKFGFSVHDLPDCPFYDWYEEGASPLRAAMRCVRAAMREEMGYNPRGKRRNPLTLGERDELLESAHEDWGYSIADKKAGHEEAAKFWEGRAIGKTYAAAKYYRKNNPTRKKVWRHRYGHAEGGVFRPRRHFEEVRKMFEKLRLSKLREPQYAPNEPGKLRCPRCGYETYPNHSPYCPRHEEMVRLVRTNPRRRKYAPNVSVKAFKVPSGLEEKVASTLRSAFIWAQARDGEVLTLAKPEVVRNAVAHAKRHSDRNPLTELEHRKLMKLAKWEEQMSRGARKLTDRPHLPHYYQGKADATKAIAESFSGYSKSNPSEVRIPFRSGQSITPAQMRGWIESLPAGPVKSAFAKRFQQSLAQYRKFHLGSEPKSFTYRAIPMGTAQGITDVDFVVSEGKEWTAAYQVPKHSRKYDPTVQGRYVHAHGESGVEIADIKRPAPASKLPERFHTADGKFVGVVPSKNVTITDWYKG